MTTQTLPDLSRRADRIRLSAALPAVIRMLDAWQLTREQQAELLTLGVRTVQRASKGTDAPELSADQLTRLSLITGIYKALHTLYTLSPDTWPQRPNNRHPFLGRTPLELMLTSGIPGLLAVRRLLDGDRGGQYSVSPQARAEADRLPQPDLDLD
ncbi:hypothetical protein DM785_16735 (plasmid) [Deinococcus actinosclerus]|nr:hypothetical protein DM785_16735 [Deinococcus actinosclerus]